MINDNWQQGQLSSIQTAVRRFAAGWHRRTHSLPRRPCARFRKARLRSSSEAFDSTGGLIIIPTFQGRRGHPPIFRASLYDMNFLPRRRKSAPDRVVWAHAQDIVEVPTDEEGVILNLNDPATLKKALEGAG